MLRRLSGAIESSWTRFSPVDNVVPAKEHRDAKYTIGVLMVSLAEDLDAIKDKMQRCAIRRDKAHE
jgi:hypothetical protein